MKLPIAALAVCMLPVTAAAQEAVAAQAVAQNSGPMLVQPMHNTFVVAPDFKISRFDGSTVGLLGAYGGWLLDQHWLIGAGGYGLVSGSAGQGLGYGGGVLGWNTGVERPVGFAVRSLVGWGVAHIPGTATVPVFPYPMFGRGDFLGPPLGPPTYPTYAYPVRYRENFFVAEPQADLILRVTSWGRLDLGAGYRAVAGAGAFDRQIRGATASISFQVGNF